MRAERRGLDIAAPTALRGKCPVSINTGELVKTIREEKLHGAPLANKVSLAVVDHFQYFDKVVRPFLNLVSTAKYPRHVDRRNDC